ncbi:MAG TPA: ABC transporter permease [Thermomicrobiales bacterium]|nr:ABC transporter permease [Thermomicrobiales bacterium]
MEHVILDVRHSLRSAFATPLFTFMAVAIVALGVASNALVFSVAHAVLFRPLPFDAPEQLVRIYEVSPEGESTGVAPATFGDLRRHARSFTDLATLTLDGFNLTGNPVPEVVMGAWVSPELFSMLGIRPAFGRVFSSGEDHHTRTAVISHALWVRRFGSDPAVVDTPLALSSHDRPGETETFTIVGVLPADFWFLRNEFEIWLPLTPGPADLTAREPRSRPVIARLKSGVTIEQATAEMQMLARDIGERHPRTNARWSASVAPLHAQLVHSVRPALLMLLGAAAFVMLIACANLANVLLARGTGRAREFTVRMALGAARARVVRQGVFEALIFAGLGCVVGLVLTYWAIGLVVHVIPDRIQQGLPGGISSVAVDHVVVLAAIVLAMTTGTIFGLIPALHITKIPLNETLKATTPGSIGQARGRRIRDGLLVIETALALVLLTGAGMLMQTFVTLRHTSLGFKAEGVLGLRMALPRAQYAAPEQQISFFTEALTHVAAVPGVDAVSVVSAPPLRPPAEVTFEIDGRPSVVGSDAPSREVVCSPDYFVTLTIPVLKGRDFGEHDSASSLNVAIISETFARRHWPNSDPIGQRIRRADQSDDTSAWSTIVGIVGDVRYELSEAPIPTVYRPYTQRPSSIMSVLVRTAGPVATMRPAVLRALWTVDRDQPTYHVGGIERTIASALAQQRFALLLVAAFASLAIILASLGVYELVAYAVTARTRELAVRASLGASRGCLLRLVVGSSLKVVGIGLIAGALGAFALSHLLGSQIVGLTTPELHIVGATALLFLLVTFLASYIPARAVSLIEPVSALRSE